MQQQQRFAVAVCRCHNRNIQTGILVHDFIDDDRLALHATLVPMQSVGGDLYDFYREGDYLTFITAGGA